MSINMALSLSLSESAIEVLHNSPFSCGFSFSRKPNFAIAPRRKKQSKISTKNALNDGGGAVIDKEFEFKPSFDEYLKAMEYLKIDRDINNGNNSNSSNSNYSSSDSPRKKKKKITKKIVREEEEEEESGNGEVIERSSNRGFIKKKVFVEQDLRNGGFREKIGSEKVKDKQNWKKRDTSESRFVDSERAAFKPLEYEDVVDKPRVSRLDMEERIQKLAKW